MYSDKVIDEARATARELRLAGWELLAEASNEHVRRVCNGIGPAWMPAVGRAVMDLLHPTLKVVAILHDLGYDAADGTIAVFRRLNREFAENGRKVADARFGCLDPRRYLVRRSARRCAFLCDVFGLPAYVIASRTGKGDAG